MYRFVFGLVIVLAFGGCRSHDVRHTHFPTGAFSLDRAEDEFYGDWFEHLLEPFDELALPPQAHRPDLHVYRLLQVPPQGRPLLLRLDITADGRGLLIVKRSEGGPNVLRGTLRRWFTVPLDAAQTARFTALLLQGRFWESPGALPQPAGDVEAEVVWLIEGAHQGTYHAITRRAAEMGPLGEAATMLLELGGV